MRPRLIRFLLLVVNLLVGVNAVLAGTLFVVDPSGGRIGMPLTVLRYAPFDSFLVPGLVLGLVVGGLSLRAAMRTWQHRGALPSLVAGAVLIGWILIQMGMLREVNGLQLFCLGCGLAQIGLAVLLPTSTTTADRARRFLQHRRVALIGLSRHPEDFSRAVARELEAGGYDVVGVDRTTPIQELPAPPKAAILMVPAGAAAGVVDQCVAAGVEAIWFHRGAGAGSASPEAVAKAEAAGLLVVTDACPLMYLGHGSRMHGAHRWMREHSGASPS